MTDLGALAGMLSPPAADRFHGVAVGVVTNNQDPDGLGRIKVRFPWLADDSESFWARVLTPMAGNDRGLYFLPEIDDEVLIAFEHGRPDFAYVLGGLWNGKDKPPESNDDGENNLRVIKSRSGHTIRLDDTEGAEKIEIVDSAEKQSIVIDSVENTITIVADGDLAIKSANGKLELSGKNGVEITSEAGAKVQASQNLELGSDAQVNVTGSVINLN